MLCVIALLSPEADQSLTQLRETALPGGRFARPLHAHMKIIFVWRLFGLIKGGFHRVIFSKAKMRVEF